MTRRSTPCVVVAPLGPNPAPLVELIWALYRERGWWVTDAYVVTTPRGMQWLETEVLRTGAALDELCQVLGQARRPWIHVDVLAVDDADEADSRAWREGMWAAARRATESDVPAVFGLLAGRRRTMTAMATVTAQLLARPGDLCVDVRVSLRAAEGGSGFFFPEQARQSLHGPYGTFEAREVDVQLVDVLVPRLAGVVPTEALASWESALAAGQGAIDALRPPRLVVELSGSAPTLTVDHTVLPLAGAKRLAFIALVLQRLETADGWLPSGDEDRIRALVAPLSDYAWTDAVASRPWQDLLGQIHDDDFEMSSLAKARSDLRRSLVHWCQKNRPAWHRWLVPELEVAQVDGAKQTSQRLPLPASCIELKR